MQEEINGADVCICELHGHEGLALTAMDTLTKVRTICAL